MTIALLVLALLAVTAVVATIVQIARDGYRRVPTRAGTSGQSATPAQIERPQAEHPAPARDRAVMGAWSSKPST